MDSVTEALLTRLTDQDRAYLPGLLRRLGVRGRRSVQDAIDAAASALRAAGWAPRHRSGVVGGYRDATWRRHR